MLLILAPGCVITAGTVKLIVIKCYKQKCIKRWKTEFIFNIRAKYLVRVNITSLLRLTHDPANLLYELDSWKPSSSLAIQVIPYFYWTGPNHYVRVRQNPPQIATFNPVNSLPSHFCKKEYFSYTHSFSNEILFIISIIVLHYLSISSSLTL